MDSNKLINDEELKKMILKHDKVSSIINVLKDVGYSKIRNLTQNNDDLEIEDDVDIDGSAALLTKKDVGNSKETSESNKSNDYDEKEETVKISASRAPMNTSKANDEKQSVHVISNIWDGVYSTGSAVFSSLEIRAGGLSIGGEPIKQFEWNPHCNELKWDKQKIKGQDSKGAITFTLRNDLKRAIKGKINSDKISGKSAKATNNKVLTRAMQYAPLFRFHKGEKYHPISIDQFLQFYAKYGLSGEMDKALKKFDEDAPVYVFHSKNGNKDIITYALLYSYNLYSDIINVGNHAADLEYVSLLFIDGVLMEFYASAHSAKGKGPVPVTSAGLFESTHVIMDITRGSHGNDEVSYNNKKHTNWPIWGPASFKFFSKDNPINLTAGEYDFIAKNRSFTGKVSGFLSKWAAGTRGSASILKDTIKKW